MVVALIIFVISIGFLITTVDKSGKVNKLRFALAIILFLIATILIFKS